MARRKTQKRDDIDLKDPRPYPTLRRNEEIQGDGVELMRARRRCKQLVELGAAFVDWSELVGQR